LAAQVACPAVANLSGVIASIGPDANFTGFAVAAGGVLAAMAVGMAVPAVLVFRSVRGVGTAWRGTGRVATALVLVCAALLPAYGAGWLFHTAARGDYQPFASLRREKRPGCEQMARWEGLRGSAHTASVHQCIDRAVKAYFDD
jgi:hypothetical protein